MKTKNKKPIIVFFALGFFLIISSLLLRYFFGNIEGPYYSYENGPFHTVTTITSFLGVFLCIAAIGITIASNVSNNGSSLNKDPRLDHKGVDKTKKFATGEFVSAYSVSGPTGYIVQDTRFSLLTPKYNLYEDIIQQGLIAFYVDASLVESDSTNTIDVWRPGSFHAFSGTSLMK